MHSPLETTTPTLHTPPFAPYNDHHVQNKKQNLPLTVGRSTPRSSPPRLHPLQLPEPIKDSFQIGVEQKHVERKRQHEKNSHRGEERIERGQLGRLLLFLQFPHGLHRKRKNPDRNHRLDPAFNPFSSAYITGIAVDASDSGLCVSWFSVTEVLNRV